MKAVVERVVDGLWRKWLVVGVVEKVVGIVVKVVGVVEVVGGWRCGWSKITIVKEKRLPQRSQPG